MARLTLSNDQVRVYDDFLPPEVFESVVEYASTASYSLIHGQAWHKAWSLSEGLPLRGPATYHRLDDSYEAHEEPRYPTHTVIDALLEAISGVAGEIEPLVGKRGEAWNAMYCEPYLHPRGCGLAIHRDNGMYAGSFTLYAHRQWDPHWGGHLLVLDASTGAGVDIDSPQLFPFLSDENENRVLCEPGMALAVLPKPNRFVVIKENAYHMVTRVDANVGDRVRASFSGFFMSTRKNPYADQLT